MRGERKREKEEREKEKRREERGKEKKDLFGHSHQIHSLAPHMVLSTLPGLIPKHRAKCKL